MDDLISRQAAIDALCDNCDHVQAVCAHYPCKQYIAVEKLPSVQPDAKDIKVLYKNIQFAPEELGLINENICHIIPEQKRGKWIWDDFGYHCSECYYHVYGCADEVLSGEYKFCPFCGAENEGEEDVE